MTKIFSFSLFLLLALQAKSQNFEIVQNNYSEQNSNLSFNNSDNSKPFARKTKANYHQMDSAIGYNSANKKVSKIEYVHAIIEKQRILSIINYTRGAGNWIKNLKEEYNTDSTGRLNSYVHFTWIAGQKRWMPLTSKEYYYNKKGQLIETKFFEWREAENKWHFYMLDEHQYDVNLRQHLTMTTDYNETTKLWQKYGKQRIVYDSVADTRYEFTSLWSRDLKKYEYVNSKEIKYLNSEIDQIWLYKWQNKTQSFIKEYHYSYLYDSSVVADSAILPLPYFPTKYIFDVLQHKVHQHFQTVYDDKEQATTTRYEYFYSLKTSKWGGEPGAISEKNNSKIAIFPNPTNEFITIDFENKNSTFNFALYQLNGQLIFIREAMNQEKISLEDLPSGIYCYYIYTEKVSFSGRVIKN